LRSSIRRFWRAARQLSMGTARCVRCFRLAGSRSASRNLFAVARSSRLATAWRKRRMVESICEAVVLDAARLAYSNEAGFPVLRSTMGQSCPYIGVDGRSSIIRCALPESWEGPSFENHPEGLVSAGEMAACPLSGHRKVTLLAVTGTKRSQKISPSLTSQRRESTCR